VQAQTKRQIYIDTYKDIAVLNMRLHGIPASITLAQGILESGDGQSRLAREGNNHFGIKCHDWTGQKIYHDDDEKNECFRKYKHAAESFEDHSEFLTKRSRYAELFTLEKTDYKGWAHGLQKAGYATSKTYATSLIKLIEDNQLFLFDQEALAGELTADQRVMRLPNGARYVVLGKNETLEQVADLHKRSVRKLLKYNDLTYEAKLAENDKVFIRKKKRNSKAKIYKVKNGDTTHSISQKEGVRLSRIYKMNKKPVGWQPKAGDDLRMKQLF
jgi:LysM repeat protein